jgi:hypothetical protein
MRLNRTLLTAVTGALLLAGVGCAHHYPPPPPPPPPTQPPALIQTADHNGFETGRADGDRDSSQGLPFRARATRAYHDTPGYDPQLGPFGPYSNAFRNAYLRGYDRGYYHR